MRKGKLLVSSCVATSATVLMCATLPTPALAQSQGSCTPVQNSTCWQTSNGTTGTQPTTDSQSGGAGGAAENWTIDTSTVGTLPFQDNGDPNNPISPINLLSIGHADDE
jgi:hypothetical protein